MVINLVHPNIIRVPFTIIRMHINKGMTAHDHSPYTSSDFGTLRVQYQCTNIEQIPSSQPWVLRHPSYLESRAKRQGLAKYIQSQLLPVDWLSSAPCHIHCQRLGLWYCICLAFAERPWQQASSGWSEAEEAKECIYDRNWYDMYVWVDQNQALLGSAKKKKQKVNHESHAASVFRVPLWMDSIISPYLSYLT